MERQPSTPRQAAAAILVRDGPSGLELLLVQRNPAQRFMGGFWVFPGGALDEGENHREAAVRELAEEAGVTAIEPGSLVAYSHWITPEVVPVRFDTRFFLACAPDGACPRVDGRECVDLRWTRPRAALDGHARDELALAFPTLRQLEGLAEFTATGALLAHARSLDVRPILPRVLQGAGGPRIVLPGEPGYE